MFDSITDADQASFFAGYSGTVYLIHFEEKLHHAQHYLGFTTDLAARMAAHRAGTGARLMEVITEAGIRWVLARVWSGKGRTFERRLKSWSGSAQFCPICQGKVTFEAVLAEQAPPAPRTAGRRVPFGPERPVHFHGGAQ